MKKRKLPSDQPASASLSVAEVKAAYTGWFYSEEWRYFHAAVIAGNLPHVRALLANRSLLNSPDEMNYTPLHQAAFYGREAVAEYLIDQGASVDAVNELGETPADAAKSRGFVAIAKLIAKKGGGRR